MDFGQHSILVTGASSGIGREIACALHRAGAHVLAAGRDPARLQQLAAGHPGLATIAADLSTAPGLARFTDEIFQRAPNLSILINNAAVQHPADHAGVSDRPDIAAQIARAHEELALNCGATVGLTLALLPHLKKARHPSVVFITSGLALAPRPGAPVYCATKAFVRSFARSLRYQCEARAPHVHIMEVLPPLVDTPMTAGRGTGKIAPVVVARATLLGLQRRSPEVFVGKVRLLAWIHRLSPSLAARIMRRL